MADTNFQMQEPLSDETFREAVSINASRIYDSCSDKDCLEDLRIYFTDVGQNVIDAAYSVKAKEVDVLNVYMDVGAIPFNKGFYSVDLTYYFRVRLEACVTTAAQPTPVDGLAVFCKKVILYGSDGNVKTFSSDTSTTYTARNSLTANLPRATVQVAQPIALACDMFKCCSDKRGHCAIAVPTSIAALFAGDFTTVENPTKAVSVTLGLFSIVQLERIVQIIVPSYDYSVPDKECTTNNDNPCELFNKIKFPYDDFFPPRLEDVAEDIGCRCDD